MAKCEIIINQLNINVMKAKWLLILSAMLVFSCTQTLNEQDVPVIPVPEEEKIPINIATAVTKVTDTAFEKGDAVGLYVVNQPAELAASGNHADNVKFTFDGDKWVAEKELYWYDDKTPADFYAYYPYMGNVDIGSYSFSVQKDQSTEAGYKASELLFGKTLGVAPTPEPVLISTRHLMSCLLVELKTGTGWTDSDISGATVTLLGLKTAAKVDLKNIGITPDGEAAEITPLNLGAGVFKALVVPQSVTDQDLVKVKVGESECVFKTSVNLLSGNQHKCTKVVNRTSEGINIGIDPWEDGDVGDDDGVEYTDLSAAGTANCYLVNGAGDYKFKAVQGNTDGTVGNVKSVAVLWESFGTSEQPNVGDLITKASYKNGYIRFSTPTEFRQGNAVIAAKNSKGVILWSWHIWLSSEGWKAQVYYNDAGTMMDRNLGALSATPGDALANGLFYQWGRKDPFLGASSVDSNTQALSTGTWTVSSERITIDRAEENPTTFYSGWSNYLPDGNWTTEKTAYDPCPVGWRAPDGGEEGVWVKASGNENSFNINANSHGLDFTGVFGADKSIWYPASGYLNGYSGVLGYVGSNGYCWSAAVYDYDADYAYYLGFYGSGYVSPQGYNNRSNGFPVRCSKE